MSADRDVTRFVGLRKFIGKTLPDVIRYVQVDLHKGFHDLTTVLNRNVSNVEVKEKIMTAAKDVAASNTQFNAGFLVLPPGRWMVNASCMFRNPGAVTITVEFLWLSLLNPTYVADTRADGIEGYSISRDSINNTGSSHMVYVRRYIETNSEVTVYLGAQVGYGGGAPIPTYQASITATGFVEEIF